MSKAPSELETMELMEWIARYLKTTGDHDMEVALRERAERLRRELPSTPETDWAKGFKAAVLALNAPERTKP